MRDAGKDPYMMMMIHGQIKDTHTHKHKTSPNPTPNYVEERESTENRTAGTPTQSPIKQVRQTHTQTDKTVLTGWWWWVKTGTQTHVKPNTL